MFFKEVKLLFKLIMAIIILSNVFNVKNFNELCSHHITIAMVIFYPVTDGDS